MGGMLGKTMEDNFKKQQEFMLEMNRCIMMLLTILWIRVKSSDPGSPLRDRSRCRTRWGRGWWRARQVCKLTKTTWNSNWWNLKTPIFLPNFRQSIHSEDTRWPGRGRCSSGSAVSTSLRGQGCLRASQGEVTTQQYNSILVSKKTSS